ncbi:MAG: hypothetical protein Q8L84_01040 [Hyphomonas sp.]|nr:hypothetical protein [Hyphomonas sp.]
MKIVRIGTVEHGLSIDELDRFGPGIYDFGTYDVDVRNGAFVGRANCYFSSRDFADLSDALKQMHRELSGCHKFEPIESQLVFTMTINMHGHIRVEGELFESAGEWNPSVKFSFQIDQSYLPEIIASLNAFLN